MFINVYDADNYHIGQGGHDGIEVFEDLDLAKDEAELSFNSTKNCVTVYEVTGNDTKTIGILDSDGWWLST